MRVSEPHNVSAPHIEGLSNESLSDDLLELGLNLGDLVPYQLDDDCLRLGEDFCDAEIHGPRAAWEGVEE